MASSSAGRTRRSTYSRTRCTTAPSVFEGVRCYDTEIGPAVFRNQDHVERLFRSSELYYMPIPFEREQIRQATLELIARNGLRSCYIRPLVFRGYGTMGLFPLEAPRRRRDRRLGVGRLPRRGGQARRHPRQGLLVAAHQPRLADPARQGRRPVPQQRAREGRDAQGRLRRGDPARRPGPRLRGLGREHLRRARRRRSPRRRRPRRSSTASTARPRSRSPATSASRSSSATSRAPSSTSPTRSS